MNIFASIRKEPQFAPKSIQPSMSWWHLRVVSAVVL
jgi:hypothetical protein